ncbi:hypothetical protein [Mesorhizobium sp.]|uniref:hypothetical protein n=1 Tax=Mesorhizobium sp. TaxID=1871066 RepID=UPI00257E7826|nr:hypothetical protein [Mesorhizobium sp.]
MVRELRKKRITWSLTTDVMSQIIRHVCSSSLEKIPKQAIERAKLSILDTVACAIGGSNDPIAHLARKLGALAGGAADSTDFRKFQA